MPIKLSTSIQAGLPAMDFGSMPAMMEEIEWEEEVGNSLLVREPVGVVGAITPWNYPLHQIAAKVAPALASGSTIVVKPSEVTPLCSFVLAEVIEEVGLPAGVFNLVTGVGTEVGEALASHPDVDMVSFTGSTRAGKRVSELAAADVKKVALELGGKSANVILDDADLDEGDSRRRHQVLPQLRPDLLGADAHAGTARQARRGRGDRCRGRRAGDARRPVRRDDAARAAGLGGSARARARLHQSRESRRARGS